MWKKHSRKHCYIAITMLHSRMNVRNAQKPAQQLIHSCTYNLCVFPPAVTLRVYDALPSPPPPACVPPEPAEAESR